MKNFLLKTLADFTASAKMAARAFDSDGQYHEITASGLHACLNVKHWHHMAQAALEKLYAAQGEDCVTLDFYSDRLAGHALYLSAFYLDRNLTDLGVLVIGPYVHQENCPRHDYRPKNVIPHLVGLARLIAEDNLRGHEEAQDERPTGYHMKRAQQYIEQNFPKNLQLVQLADALNLNRSYLSRLFKAEAGVPFTAYIQNIRIEKSKELLCATSAGMMDIARAVGFSDQSYFSRCFKQHTGLTPQQYRNRETH